MINETNAAYLCPECENINLFKINLFSFSGNRKKTCTCACGKSEVTFTKNANKSVTAEFICPVCNEDHTLVIPSNQFWTSESFSFPCTYYEATSLIIGRGSKFEESIQSYLDNELEPITGEHTPSENPLMEKIRLFSESVYNHAEIYRFCNCNSTYSVAYNEFNAYIICDECNMSKKIPYTDIFKNK